MRFLKAFLAGFLSTLIFHQGILAILHAAGATPRPAYAMGQTPPLGVPAVLSLAFWGGLWGILLWYILSRAKGAKGMKSYWILALLFGAMAPTAVAFFVVFPLKGQPVAGGWQPDILAGALLLNGAWGIGVASILRLFDRFGATATTSGG
jgi:hypothetical protein